MMKSSKAFAETGRDVLAIALKIIGRKVRREAKREGHIQITYTLQWEWLAQLCRRPRPLA